MQSHLAKSGTPTMGGVLILIGIGVSTLLWFDWSNRFVWIVMLVTFGFGAIGWVDDWRKVVQKNPEGMRSREKYFWQSADRPGRRAVPGVQRLRDLEPARAGAVPALGAAAASRTTCRRRPT